MHSFSDEDGLLRMSFLEHLEELRSRILRALAGFGLVFLACIVFSDRLWLIVQAPAVDAFRKLGSGNLVGINAMEQFEIIWMWTPLVASLFLGSPWILYQMWAFISPGLYERERKLAAPFVLIHGGAVLARWPLRLRRRLPLGADVSAGHRPVRGCQNHTLD